MVPSSEGLTHGELQLQLLFGSQRPVQHQAQVKHLSASYHQLVGLEGVCAVCLGVLLPQEVDSKSLQLCGQHSMWGEKDKLLLILPGFQPTLW
jgi:hypothetical protein